MKLNKEISEEEEENNIEIEFNTIISIVITILLFC